ncbi:lysine-specific histone demethylase 2-like isoform X5 [Montipora capricornis]|uniref:lysine-specific histone demethylase 2-like isoform X5 n=1 Tax=Montipora capricornis TaxID=246305 RepID=UPI0035F10FD2
MDIKLAKWRSPRTVKRKQFFDDDDDDDDLSNDKERFRACEKAGCPAKKPTCCARFDETCAGAGYTSRWYHMSDGEHFCNACFDFMYRRVKRYWSVPVVLRKMRVSAVNCAGWLESLTEPPLLQSCPAAPFLMSYFPDGVGLSPTLNNWKQNASDLTGYVKLFYHPDNAQTALTFRPDIMEKEEKEMFPEFVRYPMVYLALRNLILSLWMINHKEFLTPERCAYHIILRGLVRVLMVAEVKRVLFFLAKKGFVNHGILPDVPKSLRTTQDSKLSVIVIGAGAAGLSAARHLDNFGIKGMVVESRERIGGRVWDDKILGCCVGRGAQILTGCINNPLSVLCEQSGLTMHHISSKCDLLMEDGQFVDSNTDSKVEFHFNALLDAIAEEKRDFSDDDKSLEDKVLEMHKQFLVETEGLFTEIENKVLQFHLGNLEFSCAAPLCKVSSISWDQNEDFPQFSGDHTLLHHGFGILLYNLAQNLDIRLQFEVKEIDYSGDKVVITSSDGRVLSADKVIVTVPLFVLKSGRLKFIPDLPERKQMAIQNLGAGLIEKVVLKFKCNFWEKVVQDADFFGHVPESPEGRGSCGLFYDLSSKSNENTKKTSHVLMTVLSGETASRVQQMTDEEVVDMCMVTLRKLFPHEIPDPEAYLVTNWGRDPYSGMAYSYIPVGSTGEEYDHLACDIDNRVFFAGEATNRCFPQTVTGAYLSGIREAAKIVSSLESSPTWKK